MFEPAYDISTRLLMRTIGFERAMAIMGIVPVPSDWEGKIRHDCLTRGAQAVLRVYGNAIQSPEMGRIITDDPGRDERAEEVAQRVGVVAKERDVQMVLNFLNANKYKEQLGYLSMRFKQAGFVEKDLTQLNSLSMEKLVSSKELGVFRMEERGEGWLGNRISVPSAVEVSYQIEDFFSWFISADAETINPILKAGVCLYEIIRIQPFDEGSMLSGVLFTDLFLSSVGYELKGLWVWEEELFRNKEAVLNSLVDVEKKGGDLTGWLEYFVGSLESAALKAKARLMTLVGEQPVFRSESGKAISLSERQIAIMEDLTLKGETTIKDIRAILPSVSEDTVLRDLKDLIEKKLVKKKGHTRGARYALGKVKYFR